MKVPEHYFMCNDCAESLGGKFPPDHVCTVSYGECPYCLKKAVIIPWVDFDWKDSLKLDKVAKANRD